MKAERASHNQTTENTFAHNFSTQNAWKARTENGADNISKY